MPPVAYNRCMTSAERDRAVSYLEETRTALVESTRGLEASRWWRKPSPQQWCPAECIEHLSITERHLCSVVRSMAVHPPASDGDLALAAGKEDLIVKHVPGRGRKVKGPPESIPQLEAGDAAAVLERFLVIRDRTIDFARSTDHPLRTRLYPHFVFGPLDGFQWLIFMAAHSERHRRQIEEAVSGIA